MAAELKATQWTTCRRPFNAALVRSSIALSPGDVIVTGTPVTGYPKDKQVWLKLADRVCTTISKIGER